MISINNDIANNIQLLIDEADYYLFVCRSNFECEDDSFVLTSDEVCGAVRTFTIDHNFNRKGHYTVNIYGQDSYSNLDPDLATLLYTTQFNINPEPCEL